MQFCEIMNERVKSNGNFHYWANTNPGFFHEIYAQNHQKLNIWVIIIENSLLGHFFLPENSTGGRYVDLLENVIKSALTNTI